MEMILTVLILVVAVVIVRLAVKTVIATAELVTGNGRKRLNCRHYDVGITKQQRSP